MIDFSLFPSPCYIMEENLLRKNLSLIKSVADRAGVEIILAFKSFALWRSFPIFREYVQASTASSLYEARLALEEFGSKAHTIPFPVDPPEAGAAFCAANPPDEVVLPPKNPPVFERESF